MELLVLLLVVVAVLGGVSLYRRHAVRQREDAERAALESQLSTSKRAADEDVTKFGEELQRLDVDVAGHPLDEAMQQDYQRALDAYEDAKSSLDAVQRPEETAAMRSPASGPGGPAGPCRPSGRRASSTRPTGPAPRTWSVRPRVARSARSRPAPRTRNVWWPAPTPTSAPSRWVRSASPTGRAARRTPRGRSATTVAGPAAT